ncbi:hypothetical protein [Glutamicibacter sp. NPDC090743]|uniref:hypothetical protein n=1 Tax=Glutamicibacter sp. NPDC090743 TaxID=3364001 RepID=UPI003805CAE9
MAAALSLGFSGIAASSAAQPAAVATVATQPAAKKVVKSTLTVNKIGTKTVTENTVKVAPSFKRTGTVKVSSAKLTVTQGKKTLHKSKPSVNLKPGKYKVTQSVSYKTKTNGKWSKAKVAKKTQDLTVKVIAWQSYGKGLQKGAIDGINKYRKSVKLKPLVFDKKLSETTLAKFKRGDLRWLTAQKSWYETSGPAKSKAKNNDWHAAGYKDGLANTKTKYMLETFKNKKTTKIGVTTWVWYDNKKNPNVAEIWAIAK